MKSVKSGLEGSGGVAAVPVHWLDHTSSVCSEAPLCIQHIIHEVVQVGPIDEPVSLVARVHGGPAELVVGSLSLHEAPHGTTHHGDWLLAWQQQDLAHLVNLNALTEELA